MTAAKRLVVVQNRPTQFDVPLYARIHKEGEISLTVFYTDVDPSETVTLDREMGIAPQWDHLTGVHYCAWYSGSAIRLWGQIVAIRPAHVIICGWYPRSHALLALLLRLSGIRIGVRSDNTLAHTALSGLRGRLKRTVMLRWLRVYHAWHPVGSLAHAYLAALSDQPRPVFLFRYSVPTDWFAEQAARFSLERSDLRKELAIRREDFVVLGVMKWSQREDPLTLVEAVLHAAQSIPEIKLILVGEGPLRGAIEGRIKSEAGRVIMPGYAKYSELPMYYALSDLFVHPAVSEPYGVSVQEAMSCGLPVIVSDKVGAAADLVEPGVNGDVFPVGDVAGLADRLIRYAGLRGSAEMAAASRRKAADWSYSRTLEELRRCLAAVG